MQLLEQRQRDRQAGLGVNRATPIDPPSAHLAAERVAGHLLDANRVHMNVQRRPAVGASAPDTIDVWAAGQHLFDMYLAAQVVEPAGQRLSQSRLARRPSPRPSMRRADARDTDQARQPAGEVFLGY